MKKAVLIILAAIFAALLAACAGETTDGQTAGGASRATETLTPVTENAAPDVPAEDASAAAAPETDAGSAENGPFKYRDAYDMFSDQYAHGHAEYLEYVENQIETLKEEISVINGEIVASLEEKYDTAYVPFASKDPYDKYYEDHVKPYEEYYASRMEAADKVVDSYLAIVHAAYPGGNSGGDSALLWSYVHYRNLRDELLDLKDFIG